MSRILFLDYDEVGAFMKNYCLSLNKGNRVKAAYLSFGKHLSGHNSNHFHHNIPGEDWDYSKDFTVDPDIGTVDNLEGKAAHLSNVIQMFRPDTVVAAGKAAAVAAFLGTPYRYITFGYDVFQYAFNIDAYQDRAYKHKTIWHLLHCTNQKLSFEFHNCGNNIYAECIAKAEGIMITPYALKSLECILDKNVLFYIPHCVQKPEFTPEVRKQDNDLIFLCTTRHLWGKERKHAIDSKGIDIIIDSLAIFRKISGREDFKLYLVHKGQDVKKTKNYISSKNMDKFVEWLPEMPRTELFRHYAKADFVFGQFGYPILEYTAAEPLSLGIPTATWLGDQSDETYQRVPFYKEFPPVCNSKNPVTIAEYILELFSDSKNYEKVTKDSQQWFDRYCSLGQLEEAFMNLKELKGETIKEFTSTKTSPADNFTVTAMENITLLDDLHNCFDSLMEHSKNIATVLTGNYEREAVLITKVTKHQGYCYIAPIPPTVLKNIEKSANHSLIITYDGKPLLYKEDNHAEIRRLGNGRYSLWGKYIFFSLPDNPDIKVADIQLEGQLFYSEEPV